LACRAGAADGPATVASIRTSDLVDRGVLVRVVLVRHVNVVAVRDVEVRDVDVVAVRDVDVVAVRDVEVRDVGVVAVRDVDVVAVRDVDVVAVRDVDVVPVRDVPVRAMTVMQVPATATATICGFGGGCAGILGESFEVLGVIVAFISCGKRSDYRKQGERHKRVLHAHDCCVGTKCFSV